VGQPKICRILAEAEKRGANLALERPITVSDLLRLERLVTHLAEAREKVCPPMPPELVLPEPTRTRFCEMLTSTIEDVIRIAEEKGLIERPQEFTSLIYWGTRLKEVYECP